MTTEQLINTNFLAVIAFSLSIIAFAVVVYVFNNIKLPQKKPKSKVNNQNNLASKYAYEV